MPNIYLSPSTQEGNYYVDGGTEEEIMNRIADAMAPYLASTGIRYTRNTPEMTAATSIAQSNAGSYDLHLALHSNAAPDGRYGELRGSDIYHYPGSARGIRASNNIARYIRSIYPIPNLVRVLPTTNIGEVRRTKAPAVFMEIAYHDNPEDAAWIKSNADPIARAIVRGLADEFGIPFLEPVPKRTGVVRVRSGNLNIRSRPSLDAPVIAQAANGTRMTVLNEWQGWYLVEFSGVTGYASAEYITLI